MSMEGSSPARSAGPQYITPGCGFSCNFLLWLSPVWGVGHKGCASLSESPAAREPSWAAEQTNKSPKVGGGCQPQGQETTLGCPFGLNEFCMSWA